MAYLLQLFFLDEAFVPDLYHLLVLILCDFRHLLLAFHIDL